MCDGLLTEERGHIYFVSSIVYKYPYLLSFTDDAVEIRTTSNGSLVKNIGAPNLHLISYKVNNIMIVCSQRIMHKIYFACFSNKLSCALFVEAWYFSRMPIY